MVRFGQDCVRGRKGRTDSLRRRYASEMRTGTHQKVLRNVLEISVKSELLAGVNARE